MRESTAPEKSMHVAETKTIKEAEDLIMFTLMIFAVHLRFTCVMFFFIMD
jgi:hypothetical protein